GGRAALAAAPAEAPSTQPVSQQELLDEVRALRAEVDQLKAERAAGATATTTKVAGPTTAPSSLPTVDTTVAAIAKYSDDRVKPCRADNVDDVTAGFLSDRFTIQSADQKFVFRPWMHFQFRYAVLTRQNFKPDGSDQTDDGFELRRMRFGFD